MAKMNVRKITTLAMMSAISIVLVLLIRTPFFAAAPFLEYDPADIPIFIVTFAYGPLSGFIVTVIVSVIQGITVSAGSSWYGIVMHIVATGAFVIIAGLLYKNNRTRKRAAISLLVGTVSATLIMIGMNLILTPFYMKVPLEAVKSLLIPAIIPFNFLKFTINSVVTFLVYKSIRKVIIKQ